MARHGLVLGKFLPPHAGHHELVDFALARCERVTVLVLGGGRGADPAGAAARVDARAPPRRARGRGLGRDPDRLRRSARPRPAHRADGAAAERADRRRLHRRGLRRPAGRALGRRARAAAARRARSPGPRCAPIPPRTGRGWSPRVRAYLCRRVVITGAESTGTTTLARALAERLGTVWVPEVGRAVSEARGLPYVVDRRRLRGDRPPPAARRGPRGARARPGPRVRHRRARHLHLAGALHGPLDGAGRGDRGVAAATR